MVEYLVYWLIVFGLSFIVANTDGPFGVCSKFRKYVQSTNSPDWVKSGVGCIICCSFWLSMPVAWYSQAFVLVWLSSVGFVCVVTSLSPD